MVNLLYLGDLHRKLLVFCDQIATNPRLLLGDNPVDSSGWEQRTLDGKPWVDPQLIAAICVMAPELPDLEEAPSDMFSGAAEGWCQFTPEFAVGGALEHLTPEQRAQIGFIPATNDAKEGGLGSWRVHVRYHPNSTTASFSAQARVERNNTENFISKLCNDDNLTYVMRQA